MKQINKDWASKQTPRRRKMECFNWPMNGNQRNCFDIPLNRSLYQYKCAQFRCIHSGGTRNYLFVIWSIWDPIQSQRCDWVIWWSDVECSTYPFVLSVVFSALPRNANIKFQRHFTTHKHSIAFKDYPDYFVMIVLSGSLSLTIFISLVAPQTKATNRRRFDDNISIRFGSGRKRNRIVSVFGQKAIHIDH